MYDKNSKQGTSWSDEGNKKLFDAKKTKLESHHQEEQLDFLHVSSKNRHKKKSNEIAIKQLESNKEVSNQGTNWLIKDSSIYLR